MLKTTLGVVLFLGAFVMFDGSQAHAMPINEPTPTDKLLHLSSYGSLAVNNYQKLPLEDSKEPVEKPAATPAEQIPVQHAVAEGETLTIIADKYATTWMRLFAKNTQVADPNIISVGETITIPLANEQLAERPLPVIQPQVVAVSAAPSHGTQSYAPAYQAYGNSSGNTYYAGYCTWYAKNRRPDLPNNLGNADEWVYRAQAQGIATGSAPRAGAIGQQGMHVVYVESVNGDGTVTISEMNYQGLYVTSSRTVSAGSFMYIY